MFENSVKLDRSRILNEKDISYYKHDFLEYFFNVTDGKLYTYCRDKGQVITQYNMGNEFRKKKIFLIPGSPKHFGFPNKQNAYGWQPIELECFRLTMEYQGVMKYKFDPFIHKQIGAYIILRILSDTDNAIFSFYFNDIIHVS